MDDHLRLAIDRDSVPAEPFEDPVRDVLRDLGQVLSQPVVALTEQFEQLLIDPESPVSSVQRCHLQTMVGVCGDLLDLTHDYRDYAELIRGGAHPDDTGRFRLSELVREIESQFSPRAAARQLGWKCACEGRDQTVLSNLSLCLQVVDAVISNALEYTPQGGFVRVVICSQGKTAGFWSITVSDDGPGIPVLEHEHVFEPFYRLDREIRSGDGNGLGLPLARARVQALGGSIELDPLAEVGTRVIIQLPVLRG